MLITLFIFYQDTYIFLLRFVNRLKLQYITSIETLWNFNVIIFLDLDLRSLYSLYSLSSRSKLPLGLVELKIPNYVVGTRENKNLPPLGSPVRR
jgi:hypothetical protein